jgi:hypothetical protein
LHGARDGCSGSAKRRIARFRKLATSQLALVTDIDHLSLAISHATAPAFMLGAVASSRFS